MCISDRIGNVAFHRQQLAPERQKIEVGAQVLADYPANFAGVRHHFV